MKILVFVKQVPDTDDVKLDPKTGNLKRDGVQTTINPLDANAVETAVQTQGEVRRDCLRRYDGSPAGQGGAEKGAGTRLR